MKRIEGSHINDSESVTARKRGLKILLAEDQDLVRETLRRLLSSLGYEDVTAVTNGFALVQRAQQETPDLIITDVDMPVIDGLTAMDRLPDVRCIIASAYEVPAAWRESNAHRLVGCLRKPFRCRDLELLLQDALHGRLGMQVRSASE